MSGPSRQVTRLVGVYDADGTLRGELAYWLAARVGRAHCSLCEITHGLVRERDEWRRCRDALPVPFDTYHRDDQPQSVRDVAQGVVPVVVAETSVGLVVLLGPEDLADCAGSVDRFAAAIDRALLARGLSLDGRPS